MISQPEFLELVRAAIAAEGGNLRFADKYRFHPVDVSAWKRGVKPISPRLAYCLGFEPVTMFQEWRSAQRLDVMPTVSDLRQNQGVPTSRVEPLD